MKRLFTLLYIVLFGVAAHAQTPLELLDKAAASLMQSAGLQAEFNVKSVTNGKTSSPTPGTIALKGQHFKMEAGGMTTWFDGKTQWTYVHANQEVNISEPTQEDLNQINPYAFVGLYKKGYSYKMGSTTSINGNPVYEVDLLAEKRSQPIWQVVVMIDRKTYHPVQVKVRQKNEQWFILNITSLKQKTLADSYFTFQKSDAPEAELIDLR